MSKGTEFELWGKLSEATIAAAFTFSASSVFFRVASY